jgi:hypothetical protein
MGRSQMPQKLLLLLLLSQLPCSNPYLLAHLLLLQHILLSHRIVAKAISYKVIVPRLTMYFLMDQPRTGHPLSGALVTRVTVAHILCNQLLVRR